MGDEGMHVAQGVVFAFIIPLMCTTTSRLLLEHPASLLAEFLSPNGIIISGLFEEFNWI